MTDPLGKFFGQPNQGMGFALCEYLGRPRPRWARYAELKTDDGKSLKFFFFYLEGVSLYQNLFTARNVAPEILCLKTWQMGGWTEFGDWEAHLGRVVCNCDQRPSYLVSNGHRWPDYESLVEELPDWYPPPQGVVKVWARTKTAAAAWQRKRPRGKP